MTDDVIEHSLEHQQHLRTAGHIRMDGHGEDGVIHFPVNPVELISPYVLEVPRIDETVGVGCLLDEHHWRQVIEIPASRDLDQGRLYATFQGFHPFLRLLGVIDEGPAVADTHVVRLEILMHQAMVVLDSTFQEQFVGDRAEFPPRRDVAGRAPAGNLGYEVDTLVEHGFFLLAGHRDRILVGVAVYADLVPCLHHHGRLFREGFDRVAGDEPRGLDAKALEQIDQPWRADFAGEHPAGDVVRRIFAAVGTQPARNRIHVYTERTQDLFGHCFLLSF